MVRVVHFVRSQCHGQHIKQHHWCRTWKLRCSLVRYLRHRVHQCSRFLQCPGTASPPGQVPSAPAAQPMPASSGGAHCMDLLDLSDQQQEVQCKSMSKDMPPPPVPVKRVQRSLMSSPPDTRSHWLYNNGDKAVRDNERPYLPPYFIPKVGDVQVPNYSQDGLHAPRALNEEHMHDLIELHPNIVVQDSKDGSTRVIDMPEFGNFVNAMTILGFKLKQDMMILIWVDKFEHGEAMWQFIVDFQSEVNYDAFLCNGSSMKTISPWSIDFGHHQSGRDQAQCGIWHPTWQWFHTLTGRTLMVHIPSNSSAGTKSHHCGQCECQPRMT